MRFEGTDQLHLDILDVKFTFFEYPYPIEHKIKVEECISMPDLFTLACMKAFALAQRSK